MIVEHSTLELALLDEIKKVERMIRLHSTNQSSFMYDQYVAKRDDLLSRLNAEQVKNIQHLNSLAIKSAAMTLRAVNHKLRQQILRLLNENGQMNVTDIYVKLQLEQSVASQHLAILRRANVIVTERDGKFIRYQLNYSRLSEIAKFVNHLAYFKS